MRPAGESLPHQDPSAGRRRLIVNADDLGMSDGINRGILEAHRRGIVTSASLMVRWPAAADAVARCRDDASLSLGLHLDLGEWTCRAGEWVRLYEVVSTDDAPAVRAEVMQQLDRFRQLTGRNPTHLDSHQHVHRDEPVRSIVAELGARLAVPVRHLSPHVRYCGAFYGQADRGEAYPEAITAAALARTIATLSPGVTELACHPGHAGDLETMYRDERSTEIDSLCDPAVRRAIEAAGVELCSFADLAPAESVGAGGA